MKKCILVIVLAVVFGLCTVFTACKGEDFTKGLVFTTSESGGYFLVSGGEKKDYTTVKLPNNYQDWLVGGIGINAFENCTSLSKINIPNSVTVIDAGAFRGCTSLTALDIPTSVKVIGAESFKSSGLTSITLPDISEIGSQAFALCVFLQSAQLGGTISVVPDRAFLGCFSLTTVTLPDNLTSIGRGAFESCSSLTDLDFPDGLESIDNRAFADCAALTVAEFAAVKSIGGSAFLNCTALETVVLPATLENLQDRAFWGCTSLSSVTVQTASVINPLAFDLGPNLSKNFKLFVPQQMLSQYKAAEGFSTIADRIFGVVESDN